jgi:cation diffusion facilitator family transporter
VNKTRPGPSGTIDLYQQTRRAARAGLVVTLGLGLAKFLGGWLGNSLALLSDAVHSIGDALASASILLALRWAESPPDREHPYGHTRIETVAASNVALLLVGSSLWIAWEALSTWNDPSPAPHWATLVIALVSVLLNEGLFRYSLAVARRTGSKAVEASAWDQRLDVFGSLVVLLALSVTLWGGPGWHTLDHLAALAVAGIIFWAGASLFWESLQDLMDRQADPEILATLRALAQAVPGVRGVEKLLARKSGLEYFVDIHVEVDPDLSVREGHRIGHVVKDSLLAAGLAVKDVLVHIEPADRSQGSEQQRSEVRAAEHRPTDL